MPAVVGRLQTAGRIDLRHHHLTAKSFCRRRDALADQAVADHQHFFLMQGEVSGLEEGVPGSETDHMAVVQPLFDRQIVPVKDRIAWLNIPQPIDARAGGFQTRHDVPKLAALVEQGGDIGAPSRTGEWAARQSLFPMTVASRHRSYCATRRPRRRAPPARPPRRPARWWGYRWLKRPERPCRGSPAPAGSFSCRGAYSRPDARR